MQEQPIVLVEDTLFDGDTSRRRHLRGPATTPPPAPPTTPTTTTTRMDPRKILPSSAIINNDTSWQVCNLWTPSESSSSSSSATDNNHCVRLETAATKIITRDLPNENEFSTHHHPHAPTSCSDGSKDGRRIMATNRMDVVPMTPPDRTHATMSLHHTTTTTGVMWVPLGLPTAQSFWQANIGALDLLAEDPQEVDKEEEEEGQCEETVTMESKTFTSTTIQEPSLLRLRNKRGSQSSTSFPTQKEGSGTIPPMPFLFD